MSSSFLFIIILYNRYLHLNISQSVLKLIQFRDDNADIGFGSGTLAIQQSIERTNANIKWVDENKKAILEWFESQSKP